MDMHDAPRLPQPLSETTCTVCKTRKPTRVIHESRFNPLRDRYVRAIKAVLCEECELSGK